MEIICLINYFPLPINFPPKTKVKSLMAENHKKRISTKIRKPRQVGTRPLPLQPKFVSILFYFRGNFGDFGATASALLEFWVLGALRPVSQNSNGRHPENIYQKSKAGAGELTPHNTTTQIPLSFLLILGQHFWISGQMQYQIF